MFNKRIEGKNLINIFYSEIKKLVGLENLKEDTSSVPLAASSLGSFNF